MSSQFMGSIDKILCSPISKKIKLFDKKNLRSMINRKIFPNINNNRLLKINRSCINLTTRRKDKSRNAQNDYNKLRINPLRKQELSVLIFQNNDVDIVRSLDSDLNRNICNNLLFKEHLKNNIDNNSQNNLDLPNEMLGQKIHLPLIKTISVNGILESEKKLNQNKKETQRNLANTQLEEELYNNLKKINNQYNEKKAKKDEIYESCEADIKEIDELKMEIQVIDESYNNLFINNKLKNSPKNENNKNEDKITKQFLEKRNTYLAHKEKKNIKIKKINKK